jgi:hypothetical protein
MTDSPKERHWYSLELQLCKDFQGKTPKYSTPTPRSRGVAFKTFYIEAFSSHINYFSLHTADGHFLCPSYSA